MSTKTKEEKQAIITAIQAKHRELSKLIDEHHALSFCRFKLVTLDSNTEIPLMSISNIALIAMEEKLSKIKAIKADLETCWSQWGLYDKEEDNG